MDTTTAEPDEATVADRSDPSELHVVCANILAADEFGIDVRDFLGIDPDRIVRSTVVITLTGADPDLARRVVDLADHMERAHDDVLAALRTAFGLPSEPLPLANLLDDSPAKGLQRVGADEG